MSLSTIAAAAAIAVLMVDCTVQPQQPCATQCSCRRHCSDCLPSLPLLWPKPSNPYRGAAGQCSAFQSAIYPEAAAAAAAAMATPRPPKMLPPVADNLSAARSPAPAPSPVLLFSHWLPRLLRHFVRLTTSPPLPPSCPHSPWAAFTVTISVLRSSAAAAAAAARLRAAAASASPLSLSGSRRQAALSSQSAAAVLRW